MMQGIMIDCSRNGVLTVAAVKRYAKLLSAMGYNTLMLYTEDTYEVDNEPFFGHMRGRYSKDELKDLDAYCARLGIELIPCIQTLAHVNCMLRWPEYATAHDCDDILLIGSERTHTLLTNIFSTLAECFTTRKVHIGMDEADKVGLGRYLAKHGYHDRFQLISDHLHTVCHIAAEYGFETMVWSDMFCRLALNAGDYYSTADADLDAVREKANLPENVSMVYWDYYSKDYDRYTKMLALNKAFGKKVYFAGGAWTWKGFAPDNGFSLKSTEVAMRACRDSGTDGWFLTLWGDDGDECAKFSVLPTLMYAIEIANGNTDMESIKAKFHAITGAQFDTFLLLDQMNYCQEGTAGSPCKYMLYNDVFNGLHDHNCSASDSAHYTALAQTIANAPGKGEYAYIFDSCQKLCEALAVKSDLGVRTRAAYQSKDLESLRLLATDVYPEAIRRIRAFHKAFQTAWMTEKKPFGFDIQDIRLGGVIQRLTSCAERLLDFADGHIDAIPELEEVPNDTSPVAGFIWSRCVTSNVVSHIF